MNTNSALGAFLFNLYLLNWLLYLIQFSLLFLGSWAVSEEVTSTTTTTYLLTNELFSFFFQNFKIFNQLKLLQILNKLSFYFNFKSHFYFKIIKTTKRVDTKTTK